MKLLYALAALLLGACAAPPHAMSDGSSSQTQTDPDRQSLQAIIPHVDLPDADPILLGLAISESRREECQQLELRGAREGRWPAFRAAPEPIRFRAEPATLSLASWDSRAAELNLGADGNFQDGCFVNGYVAHSDLVVKDLATALAWARRASAPVGASEAASWVAQANADSLGSYQDWRLPTVEELATLMDWAEYFRDTRVDPRFFTNTEDSFWTADTLLVDGSVYLWAFDLRRGLSSFDFISEQPRRILLVRTMNDERKQENP